MSNALQYLLNRYTSISKVLQIHKCLTCYIDITTLKQVEHKLVKSSSILCVLYSDGYVVQIPTNATSILNNVRCYLFEESIAVLLINYKESVTVILVDGTYKVKIISKVQYNTHKIQHENQVLKVITDNPSNVAFERFSAIESSLNLIDYYTCDLLDFFGNLFIVNKTVELPNCNFDNVYLTALFIIKHGIPYFSLTDIKSSYVITALSLLHSYTDFFVPLTKVDYLTLRREDDG